MNLDDILDDAALAEERVKVCLNGPLLNRLKRAEQAHAEADAAAGKRREVKAETMADRKDVAKLAADVERLRSEVAERAIPMLFRGLEFGAYNALLLKHPPRPGVVADRYWGFNSATFFPVLAKASLVEPEMTQAQWDKALAKMNDSTWDRVSRAALMVNRGEDGDVPFGDADSETTTA